MSVYKPKGGPHYLYDFQRGGRRFYGTTHETERRLAEAAERRLIKEVEEQIARNRRNGRAGGMTFNVAVGRYWDEIGQHIKSPKGRRETETNLERLVAWVGPDTLMTEVTDDLVAKLVARRRGEQKVNAARKKRRGEALKPLGLVSPAQVNRSVTQLLRRIFVRARKVWKLGLANEPNWSEQMLDEPKERVRSLRHDEEARVESVERDDYRAPRLFAQITGLRRREVAGLEWRQVDFQGEQITVVGKGDKDHVIPITAELWDLLEPLRGQHPTAVFTYVCQRTRTCAKSGRRFVRGERYPITYEGLGTQMGRAFKKAGMTDFRIHDLRHTAATRTLRATGNLRIVQRLLNHADVTVTQKYAHTDLDDLRRAMTQTAEADASRRNRADEASQNVPKKLPNTGGRG